MKLSTIDTFLTEMHLEPVVIKTMDKNKSKGWSFVKAKQGEDDIAKTKKGPQHLQYFPPWHSRRQPDLTDDRKPELDVRHG